MMVIDGSGVPAVEAFVYNPDSTGRAAGADSACIRSKLVMLCGLEFSRMVKSFTERSATRLPLESVTTTGTSTSSDLLWNVTIACWSCGEACAGVGQARRVQTARAADNTSRFTNPLSNIRTSQCACPLSIYFE